VGIFYFFTFDEMRLKRKNMKRIFITLLCLMFSLSLLSLGASADVGNAFEDDWGYGDSWGGDYDYGGSYEYGGDLLEGIFFFGNGMLTGDVFSTFIILFVIAIIIVVVLSKFTKGGTHNSGQPHWKSKPAVNPINAKSEPQIINEIRAKDPEFSAEDMKAYAGDVFIKVQEAWEKRDYEIVRPYESESLFNRHEAQLSEYIRSKKTNHLDAQNIQSVILANYVEDGLNEKLTIRLSASLLDFTTDDLSGEIIRGSTTQRASRIYRLEFIRKKGVLTSNDHKTNAKECPSCGAPIAVNNTGRCEYCKNIVTDGDYGWVLNDYAAW